MIPRLGFLVGAALVFMACAVVPNAGTGVDNGAHPAFVVSNDTLPNVSNANDVGLIDALLQYHKNAIDLGGQVLANAKRQELRTMAAQIIETKGVETRRLQAFRDAWFPKAPQSALTQSLITISDDKARPFDDRALEALLNLNEAGVQLAKSSNGAIQHTQLDTLIKNIIINNNNNIEMLKGWQQAWSKA